jgi:hypothetical protein
VVTLTARCSVGSTVYLTLPRVSGEARIGADSEWKQLAAPRRPGINTSSAMLRLGPTPASGVAVAEIKILDSPGPIPLTGALGCLDSAKLKAAVAALRESGATEVKAGGHSIEATLKPGSTGLAVVAVPRIDGWRCSVDGGKAQEPTEFGGLLAVQLPESAQKVSCSYRPPGLGLGLAAGGGAVVITLALVLVPLLRRRRKTA